MNQHYDVVIIGGGIHGAGCAQLFALNGYSVLLLERFNFAEQTSSRSSKLIHGGLRYLETLQLSLVKTCLHDREVLLNSAANLVHLEKFYIPVYQSSSRGVLKIQAGLSLYALLGGLRASSRFSRLDLATWDNPDGLVRSNLKAVFQYYDGQTNDKKLTLAVIESAQKHKALCLQQTEFLQAEHNSQVWQLAYKHHLQQYNVSATLLINATGPWVNQILRQVSPAHQCLEIDLVQGTHVIFDHHLRAGIYYVEAPADQRAVFIMPYEGRVLVGTTEKIYHSDPANVSATDEEVRYLQTVAANYIPALQQAKCIESFAGVRVLPKSKKSAFKRSRDTVLIADNDRRPKIISIYGGKLTSYRSTAEKIYKLAVKSLPANPQAFLSAEKIILS